MVRAGAASSGGPAGHVTAVARQQVSRLHLPRTDAANKVKRTTRGGTGRRAAKGSLFRLAAAAPQEVSTDTVSVSDQPVNRPASHIDIPQAPHHGGATDSHHVHLQHSLQSHPAQTHHAVQNPTEMHAEHGTVLQHGRSVAGAQHTAQEVQDSAAEATTSGRPAAEPEQLFEEHHIPKWTLELVLYFPFGLALAAVRMALWVLLLAVDQPWLTNSDTAIQVLQAILGLRITWRNAELIPKERHVMVSNHVTAGDLMVLYSRPQSYVHLVTASIPAAATRVKHHRVQLCHATAHVYDELASPSNTDPVHLYPEGGMTNGKGMMKFSRGFMRFGKGLPVVPCALKVSNTFGVSTHTLTSSFLANLFWFCFSPVTRLEATVLPPMTSEQGEGNGHFVDRVQRLIAGELGVGIADLTLQQKRKMMCTKSI